jgi:hypothetical protein
MVAFLMWQRLVALKPVPATSSWVTVPVLADEGVTPVRVGASATTSNGSSLEMTRSGFTTRSSSWVMGTSERSTAAETWVESAKVVG